MTTVFQTLQTKHEMVLKDEESDKNILDDVMSYIEEARQKSDTITIPHERDQLRAILRYWAGYVNRRTQIYPEISLRPAKPHISPVGYSEQPSAFSARAVTELAKLLDHLYLELSPATLTLSRYKQRYGDPTADREGSYTIERSVRLLKTSRELKQTGLSYFHSGLIYLHWNHYLDAAHFFNEARLYWKWSNEEPYICLALFAQAVALHGGLQLEQALFKYQEAEQRLSRLERVIRERTSSVQAVQIDKFRTKLGEQLQDTIRQLGRDLRQLGKSAAAPMLKPPSQVAISSTNHSLAEIESRPSTPSSTVTSIEPPRIQFDLWTDAPTRRERMSVSSEFSPQQMSNRRSATHNRRWFVLTGSSAKLSLPLEAGDHVLVSQAGLQAYQIDELLVTTGYSLDAVYLRPTTGSSQEEVYCLGLYKGANESGAWVLFNNNRAAETVPTDAIYGHVTQRLREVSD